MRVFRLRGKETERGVGSLVDVLVEVDDTILNRENTIWIVVLSLVGQVGVPAAQVLAIEQRDPASLTFFAAPDRITRDCQTHDNEQGSRHFPGQALRSQHCVSRQFRCSTCLTFLLDFCWRCK